MGAKPITRGYATARDTIFAMVPIVGFPFFDKAFWIVVLDSFVSFDIFVRFTLK